MTGDDARRTEAYAISRHGERPSTHAAHKGHGERSADRLSDVVKRLPGVQKYCTIIIVRQPIEPLLGKIMYCTSLSARKTDKGHGGEGGKKGTCQVRNAQAKARLNSMRCDASVSE